MDEYIKRDGLLRKFNVDDMMNVNGTLISLHDARETISNFPAADVAPVRHGKWVPLVVKRENWKGVLHDFYQPYSCSICHNPNTFMGESAFCPHCGARMDGAENE